MSNINAFSSDASRMETSWTKADSEDHTAAFTPSTFQTVGSRSADGGGGGQNPGFSFSLVQAAAWTRGPPQLDACVRDGVLKRMSISWPGNDVNDATFVCDTSAKRDAERQILSHNNRSRCQQPPSVQKAAFCSVSPASERRRAAPASRWRLPL